MAISLDKTYIEQLLNTGAELVFSGGEFYLNGNHVNPKFFPDFWDNLYFSLFDKDTVWVSERGVRVLHAI